MSRPTLIYASPFAPMRSGISAYSAVLVRGLASHFEVTLLIDDYDLADPALARDFRVLRWGREPVDPAAFDHRLYNVGNQPDYHGYIYECALRWAGAVILHDVVLYYLVVGYYHGRGDLYGKLYELEGARGVQLVRDQLKARGQTPLRDALLLYPYPERLPLNAELLGASELALVHSDYARSRLVGCEEALGKVHRIPMVDLTDGDARVLDRRTLFARYGIPSGTFVIASFGFIAPTKLNLEVCDVVHRLNAAAGRKVCYVMVGDGPYADGALGRYVVKTGFVDNDEFASFVEHADLIVNLREPSMGESSASLLRALARGKPCVVNDTPWFADLPEGTVLRIDNARRREDLERLLAEWREGRGSSADLAERARVHVREHHSAAAVAGEIAGLLERTAARVPAQRAGVVSSA